MIKIELERVAGDFGFAAKDAYGHVVHTDSSPESGGINFGVRPMQLLLMGLGSCSGIDIVSILKKQRQTVDAFTMKIEGGREPGKEPSIWQDITIVFELTGDIDPDKARKACELSMDKYCSVAETLRRAGGNLKWSVKVNGK
ncbi:OsmC family peroxiredoxin [Paraflavitalea soli]|uniref:OsmC family peroxiredoxin n=1 Tax=Paraflavitalea soli TaxID=2315862 RepID=A0A3B7MRX0_9BACT|nr:OsmC family protein [Paraflavitalea soli]AXY76113.1 OsmC family peroxiredoxin [Paraflavitalea soli]